MVEPDEHDVPPSPQQAGDAARDYARGTRDGMKNRNTFTIGQIGGQKHRVGNIDNARYLGSTDNSFKIDTVTNTSEGLDIGNINALGRGE